MLGGGGGKRMEDGGEVGAVVRLGWGGIPEVPLGAVRERRGLFMGAEALSGGELVVGVGGACWWKGLWLLFRPGVVDFEVGGVPGRPAAKRFSSSFLRMSLCACVGEHLCIDKCAFVGVWYACMRCFQFLHRIQHGQDTCSYMGVCRRIHHHQQPLA